MLIILSAKVCFWTPYQLYVNNPVKDYKIPDPLLLEALLEPDNVKNMMKLWVLAFKSSPYNTVKKS